MKAIADIRSLARAHTESAIRTLAKIMTSAKAPPSARVAASEALLSRGWGKPLQPIEQTLDVNLHYVARVPNPQPEMSEWQRLHADALKNPTKLLQ